MGHESSDWSESGGAECSRIYLPNPKILSLRKEKQPTPKGKQRKGGMSSGRRRGRAEMSDRRIAALFAARPSHLCASSPPSVCLGVNASMWPRRVNKEPERRRSRPEAALPLAGADRPVTPASSVHHHTSLRRNPNSGGADVWVFLHQQPWPGRCARSDRLVACKMT